MERTRNRPGGEAQEDAKEGDSLSADELQKVLRRASELERAKSHSVAPVQEPTLDLREVERIGVESGLSREAIQKAFVEMRTGALQPSSPPTLLDRMIGPETVSAQATSPMEPDDARRRLEEILKGELLHPEERSGTRTSWAPTPGLWATIQRGVNLQGQSVWQRGQVTSEVTEAKAGPQVRSMVKVEVQPSGRQAIYGAVAPFAVLMSFAAVASQGHITPETWAVLGAVGLGSSGLFATIVRSAYQRKVKRLKLALARVMDKFSS